MQIYQCTVGVAFHFLFSISFSVFSLLINSLLDQPKLSFVSAYVNVLSCRII